MESFFKTPKSNRFRDSFSLVELMVAMTVLVLLLTIIGAVTQSTSNAVHKASGKLTTYAAARAGFDIMNEKLAQATLNTFMDYYDISGSLQTNSATFVPVMYGRVSNLQFVIRQNSNPVTAWNTAGSASATGYGQEVYFQCPEAYSTTPVY